MDGGMMKRVPEVAKRLGCSQETVRRMLRSGQIPGLKVGTGWRMDLTQVTIALSNDRPSNRPGC
jgi:excisionase family DNA binding protein